MRTPREIIREFGSAVITSFDSPDAGVRVIGESHDRYAFTIITHTGCQIRPVTADGASKASLTIAANAQLTMHNLTHGLAVNAAWELAVAVLGVITVIESFAFKSTSEGIPTVRVNETRRNNASRQRRSPTPTVKGLINIRRKGQR